MKKNNKRLLFLCFFICFIVFMIFACDMRLKTVTYQIQAEQINTPVNIVLLTDLHGEKYGKNQENLMNAIAETKPDIILLGGDLFDDNRSYKHTETLFKELSSKYPCYYVTGNHEYWSDDIDNILAIVKNYNIPILSGKNCIVQVGKTTLNICGIDDPDALVYVPNTLSYRKQLQNLSDTIVPENYNILLSHRPELFSEYQAYGFDLILSGHAHGGQWRLPYINGLFAPNQGLFPDYAGGLYTQNNTSLIVSRGLARTTTALPRIFNRPELIVIELTP